MIVILAWTVILLEILEELRSMIVKLRRFYDLTIKFSARYR